MIKISIIVPIYNIEKYVSECIDSVIKQNYINIEIILIDDGSTDGSGKLCDNYCKLDKRIRVIHCKNSGLSAARNLGIKVCTGDYIIFLDGDDFLSENCITDICEIIEKNINVDIICGKIINYYPNKEIKENFILDKKNILNKKGTEVLTYFYEEIQETEMWSAWRSIYNRRFLIDNNLFFTEGITSEDFDLVPRIYIKANRIVPYNKPFYYYRQLRPNSIINTVNLKRFQDITQIINKHLNMIKNNNYDDKFKKAFINKLANVYASYFVIIGETSLEDRESVEKIMKNLTWILKYTSGVKGRYVYFMEKIIGMKLTYKIYAFMKSIKNIFYN